MCTTLLDGSTEIRKLPPAPIFKLARVLESGEAWKRVMSSITVSGVPKYNVEHVRLIEQAAAQQKRACAEIFLEEWACSGRKRPDLNALLQLLIELQLFRAADIVADLMKDKPPCCRNAKPKAMVARGQQYGTAEIEEEFSNISLSEGNHPSLTSEEEDLAQRAEILAADVRRLAEVFQPLPKECDYVVQPDTTSSQMENSSDNSIDAAHMQMTRLDNAAPSLQLETELPHFTYAELERYTNNFNDQPVEQGHGGRKLGSGAFGSVYLGVLPSSDLIAVKKLKPDAINVEKQFCNEVAVLSRFRHQNLLQLLGYSCDTSTFCLVYQYMSNGSLQDRLAKSKQMMLDWRTRLNIALGTSLGVLYLHTAQEKPLIHRDIKSANILLDDHLVPKLGDFGLVRLGSSSQQVTTTMTATVFGTSAYMAPEAFRGDISVKLDSFSFGVVLLELLTALAPFDENREGCDLVTHVGDICAEMRNIAPVLDEAAGDWGRHSTPGGTGISSADVLFFLALDCLEEKRKRPDMSVVSQRLDEIIAFVS